MVVIIAPFREVHPGEHANCKIIKVVPIILQTQDRMIIFVNDIMSMLARGTMGAVFPSVEETLPSLRQRNMGLAHLRDLQLRIDV
jgi:hypothetical protein